MGAVSNEQLDFERGDYDALIGLTETSVAITTWADVGGAAPLGIRTAWITRRVGDPEAKLREWEGPPPDWTIADLAELEELVRAADQG